MYFLVINIFHQLNEKCDISYYLFFLRTKAQIDIITKNIISDKTLITNSGVSFSKNGRISKFGITQGIAIFKSVLARLTSISGFFLYSDRQPYD